MPPDYYSIKAEGVQRLAQAPGCFANALGFILSRPDLEFVQVGAHVTPKGPYLDLGHNRDPYASAQPGTPRAWLQERLRRAGSEKRLRREHATQCAKSCQWDEQCPGLPAQPGPPTGRSPHTFPLAGRNLRQFGNHFAQLVHINFHLMPNRASFDHISKGFSQSIDREKGGTSWLPVRLTIEKRLVGFLRR